MCMTGSDLCSSQKPWEYQESTAKVIYDEFYEQVFDINNFFVEYRLCSRTYLSSSTYPDFNVVVAMNKSVQLVYYNS